MIERIKSELGNGVSTKLIIYDELKPRHKVNLMRELGIEVLDKIELILQIFALHAGSKEAKLQIEMARITHQLPLIKEWIRRAKLGELPGFLGPGAYAIDTYYKHMKRRLAKIKRELAELRDRRSRERERRRRFGWPQVAITGYANAGKTTLFNTLTNESKPVGPEMFTTLTPKAKGAYLDATKDVKVIFVDTVGFIKDIPAEVIEAFYATLEEVSTADLAILVIDSSEPSFMVADKVRTSLKTLLKIGYIGKPLIIALNKIDLLKSDELYDIITKIKEMVSSLYHWDWSI
ncbi:MAG TPA: GTPase HflX, partial [Acidilobales archaeon]|nr:GTPase HflX [Acidilobales archaeon]